MQKQSRELRTALADTELFGIETNLSYLSQICDSNEFAAGGLTTSFLKDFRYYRRAIEIIEPGTQTTIQDYPGRLGYWHVGVPPSGPMDPLAFRIANRLVGNKEGAAGLEFTLTGPTLRFACDAMIALTGADFGAQLDGHPLPRWEAIRVKQNSLLELTSAQDAGARAYLAIAGGIDTPQYLGSRSTFILGKFGGQGRVLRAGDVLHFHETAVTEPRMLPSTATPQYGREWEIGVLYGPHGAPDFFTAEDIEMFFSTAWKVHYNSDRTGVRLIGPKPRWARKDGGEAGLHPSNIHDNAYAIGTVDFTGDMPVILGPDGPSLGGFVCPATIVEAEIWKMGQLKAGDLVRFRRLSSAQAESFRLQVEKCVETLAGSFPQLPEAHKEDAVVSRKPASNGSPAVVCRADGDRYLLIEYGPNILDLNLRFRVQALEQLLRAANLRGIVDITPGVRSLHIHYDARLRREELLEAAGCMRAPHTGPRRHHRRISGRAFATLLGRSRNSTRDTEIHAERPARRTLVS